MQPITRPPTSLTSLMEHGAATPPAAIRFICARAQYSCRCPGFCCLVSELQLPMHTLITLPSPDASPEPCPQWPLHHCRPPPSAATPSCRLDRTFSSPPHSSPTPLSMNLMSHAHMPCN